MLGLGVTTILAESAVLAVLLVGTPGEALSSDWMGRLLGRLAFSQHSLWPSRWMSAGRWPRRGGTGRTGCST